MFQRASYCAAATKTDRQKSIRVQPIAQFLFYDASVGISAKKKNHIKFSLKIPKCRLFRVCGDVAAVKVCF